MLEARSVDPGIFDVVSLEQDFGRWPAGTSGTIVDDFPGGYVVEIVAPSGATMDMLDVHTGTVRIVQSAGALGHASAGAA